MAACLAAGPGSVASHVAAATLWSFAGSPAGELHICCARQVKLRGVRVHRIALAGPDVTRLGVIPVTRPERTIIDLASMVTDAALEIVLDDALSRGIVALDRLQRRLDAVGGKGRRGGRALRRLLDDRVADAVPRNRFETLTLRAIRRAGLPEPEHQFEIWHRGELVARPDFAYPTLMIAIESDSRRHHWQPADWERDLARRNRLTRLGWLVLHVTWRALRDRPDEVTSTIARALRTRGWLGEGAGDPKPSSIAGR